MIDPAAEFPLADDIIYLNHAAVAPLPRRARQLTVEFLDDAVTHGAAHYPEWLRVEASVRRQLGQLVGAADPDDIAILKNTSEALSVVAHGFPWRDGDRVIISSEEFPSNRIVWESLQRRGVGVIEVDLRSAPDPEDALLAAIDARTRMLAVSAVQFASGLRLDLARLGDECRQRDIALCVDAIQAVGALELDVLAMQIDFLAADAHKWMLGPEGVALFYCAADWRDRLLLHQFGWHMRENSGDYDSHDWQPAANARRFECGSMNMLGIHALAGSLSVLLETGMHAVEGSVLARSDYLFAQIEARSGLDLLTDNRAGRYAGIVSFRARGAPNDQLYTRLREAGVVCAQRGGGIRFSPHFYTALEQLDGALEIVDTVSK